MIWLGIAFLILLYIWPIAVAVDNKKKNRNAIIVLDLLLGWTVIGWIVALVWATTKD